MDNALLTGRLVRLIAPDADKATELLTRWSNDAEFFALWDSDPVVPRATQTVRRRVEEELGKDDANRFQFMIQALADDRLIGETGVWSTATPNRDAWVAIGIGEREYWGKGYGSDAMNVILRFCFRELNLYRVSLSTFEYNPRAIRSYEKVGFVHEGRQRKGLLRYGRRWDVVYMGILRDEWEARQG